MVVSPITMGLLKAMVVASFAPSRQALSQGTNSPQTVRFPRFWGF